MTLLDAMPLWVALPVAALVMIGATLTLIGTLGLVRLGTFYERLHAPSLGASWGTGTVVFAAMGYFSWLDHAPVLHDFVIGTFVMVTTPVATMLLGRAALHRDMADGLIDGPAPAAVPQPEPLPAATDEATLP